MEEYPIRELLRMEKEVAGICFSGHPMDEYKEHAQSLSPDPISAIFGSEDARYGDKRPVKLCGIVTAKNVKRTKAEQEMAFVTLEDTTSSIEVIVFPRQFENQILLFETEAAIWIEGSLSLREDEKPKVVFEKGGALLSNTSFQKLAARSEPTPKQQTVRRMYLKVPSVNSPSAAAAMTLLYRYKGNLEVVFFDASTKKYKKVTGCATKEDEHLIRSLKELLGDGAVRIQ